MASVTCPPPATRAVRSRSAPTAGPAVNVHATAMNTASGNKDLVPCIVDSLVAQHSASHYIVTRVTTNRPDTIDLSACDEQWLVSYQATASAGVRARASVAGELRVRGAVHDHGRVGAALRRWLARRARATLVDRLDALSERYQLPYGRATIRFQRSRWGSCSSRGTISLNALLMFLPPELVRCVLAHELCHTAHLNHGPHFWALLDKIEPDHRALHRSLRLGGERIPRWIFG